MSELVPPSRLDQVVMIRLTLDEKEALIRLVDRHDFPSLSAYCRAVLTQNIEGNILCQP